jgi:hypothetical protein
MEITNKNVEKPKPINLLDLPEKAPVEPVSDSDVSFWDSDAPEDINKKSFGKFKAPKQL